MHSKGFTLIEMMLALAIGTIVLLVAFAAFRTVSQAIGLANRLSGENGLMRKGMLAMLDEVDFWEGWDSPDGDGAPADNGRGLRGTAANGLPGFESKGTSFSRLGMPFTPFRDMDAVTDLDGTNQPFKKNASSGDAARGWNQDLHWSAADERTWFQGNWAQRAERSDQRFGRYGMITNTRKSVLLGDPDGISVRNQPPLTACFFPGWPMPETTGTYGATTAVHTWRENQMRGLLATLGKAGLVEYMPSNTFFGSYGTYVRSNRNPSISLLDESMVNLVWGNYDFPTMTYNATRATALGLFPRSVYASSIDRTRWRMTWGGDFNVLGFGPGEWRDWDTAHETNDSVPVQMMALWHRVQFNDVGLVAWNRQGYYQGVTRDRTNAFLGASTLVRPMMERKPSDMPDVNLTITRYLAAGHLVNTCTVRWANRQTGQLSSLTFNALGTTLRGARQQRKYPTGWAAWQSPTDRDEHLDDMPVTP